MTTNINEKICAELFGMIRTGTVREIDGEYLTIQWDWAPPNYDAYEGIYKKGELKDIIIK